MSISVHPDSEVTAPRRSPVLTMLWRVTLAVPLICLGCTSESIQSPATGKSLIDSSKVIDLDAPTVFAMRITIFTYKNADANGWPADVESQKYVRFLQDEGIHVGFMADSENDSFGAMVDASDVDAVVEADKIAASKGIEKPPTVPDSMRQESP